MSAQGLPSNYKLCSLQWTCPTTRRSLHASFGVDRILAKSIEDRFGLPPSMIGPAPGMIAVSYGPVGPGTSRLPQVASAASIPVMLSQRGLVVDRGAVRVDYESIARESRSTLAPLASHLMQQVADLRDVRHSVAAVVGLAQAIRYAIPPDAADGTQKLSFRTPLAVLESGEGDCDSKVCLAASMIQAVALAKVALVVGRSHALLGVAVPTRPGDAAIAHGGTTYVVTEVTTLVPFGMCAPDEVAHGSAFEAIPLA